MSPILLILEVQCNDFDGLLPQLAFLLDVKLFIQDTDVPQMTVAVSEETSQVKYKKHRGIL